MSASSLARALNAAGLLGCSLILLVAFWFQIVLGELPCPLCVLQRAAFTAVGLGLVLNICDRPRPSHYAIVILSAVVGGAVSARQTALHIIPGTGTYGSALFGLHFYVWALIAFTGVIVAVAILCLWDRQFTPEAAVSRPETVSVLGQPTGTAPTVLPGTRAGALGLSVVLLFLVVALANAGSTFAECGFGLCPDNPVNYEMFDRLIAR
ncbi:MULTISPECIES: disulfide bond formation protein B [Methylobacterium]|uniref:Disulfide bond formation protein B n=1 Tax=Methylobacterium bullatum TaxID=570505 RepID=A0AAV4Z5T7_9HYPH|nr:MULTISPECIES: disulfide bond formation protein B [Methylobacterium]KQP53240.1 disulfide bond formation protein B [Methylobacterium sp. Leaf106]MBD8902661.1 disulfide bond formation protein B [Methylobacterium bullatum]TXN34001.1 disulfide bond formation protein B [Methylobacterium sp. WL19]GJD39322.1 Disulfide bond formation protein B [Methylobacterium bullatum]